MNDDFEENFIVPQNLSAMAKTFYVKAAKPLNRENWYLKAGSTVTGVKVIATGEEIREVNRLIMNHLLNGEKTKAKDWYKVRGNAIVTDGNDTYTGCEIHWYQCENIGKVEFKVKIWGEKIES